MSKGIWTKCYITDQETNNIKSFYYNAAKNISVWIAPKDSIIHETHQNANNTIESSNTTDSIDKVNEEIKHIESNITVTSENVLSTEIEPNVESISNSTKTTSNKYADEFLSSLTSNILNNNSSTKRDKTSTSSIDTNNAVTGSVNVIINDRIQQAVNNNQKQSLSTSSTGHSKRFKTSNNTTSNTEGKSAYEKQKYELEQRQGSKGEEGGKWLVR